MQKENKVMEPESVRELVVTRLLNAPVKIVWEAWTDPEQIRQWWGPEGFTDTISKMEVKPGGEWDHVMHGPDGTDFKNKSVFKEIVKEEKIVYEHVTGPKFISTVRFTKQGNKTMISIQMLFDTREERDKVVKEFGAAEGLIQNIDKLERFLADEPVSKKVMMTRLIDCPRELVFKAWTDPKQLAIWWGPNGFTNPVCEIDPRDGGSILIHMKGPDGTVYPMTGTFKKIIEPEKIVFTSAALDANGNKLFEVLNTVTLTQEGKKTKLTLLAVAFNVRPGAKPYLDGMNEGWAQTLDRLGKLMETNH